MALEKLGPRSFIQFGRVMEGGCVVHGRLAMSAQGCCAICRFRGQFDHRRCVARFDSMVSEPTGIDGSCLAERPQRPAVQRHPVR